MLALFLDLEFKKHVYRFYLAFLPSSPMSWGSWILILVYPAALLLGLGSLDRGPVESPPDAEGESPPDESDSILPVIWGYEERGYGC